MKLVITNKTWHVLLDFISLLSLVSCDKRLQPLTHAVKATHNLHSHIHTLSVLIAALFKAVPA